MKKIYTLFLLIWLPLYCVHAHRTKNHTMHITNFPSWDRYGHNIAKPASVSYCSYVPSHCVQNPVAIMPNGKTVNYNCVKEKLLNLCYITIKPILLDAGSALQDVESTNDYKNNSYLYIHMPHNNKGKLVGMEVNDKPSQPQSITTARSIRQGTSQIW